MVVRTLSSSATLSHLHPVLETTLKQMNNQATALYSSMGKTAAVALSLLGSPGFSVANPLIGTILIGGAVIALALYLFSSCGRSPYPASSRRHYVHIPSPFPSGNHPVGSRAYPPPPRGPLTPPPVPSVPPGGNYPVGGRHGPQLRVPPGGPPPPYPDDEGPHYTVGGRR